MGKRRNQAGREANQDYPLGYISFILSGTADILHHRPCRIKRTAGPWTNKLLTPRAQPSLIARRCAPLPLPWCSTVRSPLPTQRSTAGRDHVQPTIDPTLASAGVHTGALQSRRTARSWWGGGGEPTNLRLRWIPHHHGSGAFGPQASVLVGFRGSQKVLRVR